MKNLLELDELHVFLGGSHVLQGRLQVLAFLKQLRVVL